MNYSSEQIVSLTGATALRAPCGECFQITHLARTAGAGMIFVPINSFWSNSRWLERVAAQGCSGVIVPVDAAKELLQKHSTLGVFSLPDPAQGFYRLAHDARTRSRALVIGITGSSGKSSTKEYLASILRLRYRVHATRASLNMRGSCAEILLNMNGAPDEAAVIEMGFGHIGDIDRMAELARPDAAIITLIAPDHLDGVASDFAALITEKGKIAAHVPADGVLAINGDDPGCGRLELSDCKAQVLTFGTADDATVGYRVLGVSDSGTLCRLRLPAARTMTCRLRPIGAFQASNAAAAALIADRLQFSPAEIAIGLARAKPLPRRFHVHGFKNGITVVDDTFSATYEAARRGLDTAKQLAGGRRFVAVMTGMAQLAQRSDELHFALGQYIGRLGCDHLVLALTDRRTRHIGDGALAAGMNEAQITEVPERADLPSALLAQASRDTLIYCKGSMYLGIWPEMDAFLAALARRDDPAGTS